MTIFTHHCQVWQHVNFGPLSVWKSRFSVITCNYILFTFNRLNMKNTFFRILFRVFPKVVLKGPDKDNYPDFYKAKISEPCLSLPTVDNPQRNPHLLGVGKKRRKMCPWAFLEIWSHVEGSLQWKYLPLGQRVLSRLSHKHTSGTEDTKYREKSVNGKAGFICLCFSKAVMLYIKYYLY